jgi:uncharacterized membrane protein YoaK (UPF0700 family)
MPASAPIVSTPTWTRAIVASPVFGTTRRDLVVTGVLGAVAGYVDAAGFLGLYGLYAAHVTGDLVAAGTTVGGGLQEGLCLRLVAIVVFMISVASAALVTREARRRRQRPMTALFALLTVSLLLFCAAGVVLRPELRGPDAWAVVLTSALGVFAMGIQNALMRDALCSFAATTLMTGNLTQMTLDLVNMLLPDETGGASGPSSNERTARRIDARRRLNKSATAVFAFLLGTVLGGVAMTFFAFWSIALPAAAAGALTVATGLPLRRNVGRWVPDPLAKTAPRSPMAKRISGIQEIEPLNHLWAPPAHAEVGGVTREK